MDPAIELHRISKLYGRTVALRSVSLALEAGQTLALLGPNGSGKSTLLRIIAGATSPTIGEGSILGHDLRKERLTLRGQVAMLAADSYLYDDLTAKENLRFIATMAGRKPSSREIMVLLDRVGLAETAHARARTFSSGMKRRLGLARLMLLQPRIVLLDEPYNNLDSPGVELVDQLIQEVEDRGGGCVLATHDAAHALEIAGTAASLEAGRRLYLGPAIGFERRDVQHVG